MQNESAAVLQTSNDFHTSNATSTYFLDGQQQRSWMLPSEAQSSGEPDQSSNTQVHEARQMSAIMNNLVNSTSEVPENTARGQVRAQLREANTAIERALSGGQNGTIEQNYMQMPPSKRPRLHTQFQHPSNTFPDDRSTPLYSFVTSPIQGWTSPGSYGPTTSSPQATSMSPPPTTSVPGNIYQAHHGISVPRRLSTLSNISSPGGGSSTVHSEMRQQQPAQPHRTTSMSEKHPILVQQPTIPKRTSTVSLLPRLRDAIDNPETRDSFKDWSVKRVILLEEACKSEDWFYLTLHQVYCWRTLDRAATQRLGITAVQELQFASLDAILLPNTKLQYLALDWFAHFPTDPKDMLQGLSLDASNALKLMHIFLDKMSLLWPQVSTSCLARKYPPSPYELYEKLGMSSTVLQSVFFTFIFRQIEGGDDPAWVSRATQFFKFTQSQLIDKFNRISQGLPEAPPNNDIGLVQFASEYFALRNKHASRTLLRGNARGVQSTVQSAATVSAQQSASAMPAVRAQSTTVNPQLLGNWAPANLPSEQHYPHPSSDPRPATRPQPTTVNPQSSGNQTPTILPLERIQSVQSSGPQIGLQARTPQGSASRSQPGPPDSPTVTPMMGPRQQGFVQEMTGIIATSNVLTMTPDRSASGVGINLQPSINRVHSIGSRSSLGAIPVTSTGQPEFSVPNSALTAQRGYITLQKATRLLPPPGKLMSMNTHPNPERLALHQARLSSPRPSISKLAEPSQASSRLFQVFQRFVLPPQVITNQQTYYQWHVEVPAADISYKTIDVLTDEHTNRPVAKVVREFRRGSLLYRLRCIKLTSRLNESDWSIAPTYWPSSCFISLDTFEIELRRKSHWGKNLPCDLTRSIKAGMNTIEMSVNLGPEEYTHTFAVAVEQIEVLDQVQCTNRLTLVESPTSLASIIASLAVSENDDDISIVDPHISIDLIDPFTAQMWKIPVRGKNCTHRECFDLQAFLESRPNKHTDVLLSSADDWKCPICNKDARPQSLVLDGFLLSVSKQITGSSDQTDGVRAIQVTADGLWKPAKVENNNARREAESKDGPAWTASARSTPSVNASKESVMREVRTEEPVVIELDD